MIEKLTKLYSQMKKILLLIFLAISTTLSSQSNTEIYLLDIAGSNEKIDLINLKNISNNKGYDNQPSFYNDNTIIFSSTRNNQTDISAYNIEHGKKSWITKTALGSEYSPLKMPNKEAISAIRLDNNGLQRLYEYNLANGKSKALLEDLKVGYHVWFNSTILVSSVLVDDRMDLVVSNLKDNTSKTVQKKVGRSLHKIPNSNLIGFISNENETTSIKSLDPISGVIKTIKILPIPLQDICWLTDSTILIPYGKIIGLLNIVDGSISHLHNFKEDEINEISRISVSADGKHLALVSEESPKIIVQKQVEAFNNASLENFASCYSENVVVKNFPNDTLYIGNSKLKSNYKKFFSNNPKSKVKVVKRISNRNIVIDEELVTVNGKEHNQVALYEIENGKITSMSFIREKQGSSEVETIVQKQFETWNAKDIDNFVKTFSEDIKVYEFQNSLYLDGQKQLYDMFSELFTQSPDLLCKISNRIIIGNTVIDEELIFDKTNNRKALVIYEVEKGKIFRMTTFND